MSTLSSLSTTVNVIDKVDRVDRFDGVTVDDLLGMGWYHSGC